MTMMILIQATSHIDVQLDFKDVSDNLKIIVE